MVNAIVVEDDVEFAEKVAARLLRRGWNVDCCTSAATALAHLIKKKYQYAFVDLVLPPSSDGGIQVLRDFLTLQRESTVFLMTEISAGAVSLVDKARTLGARRFFDKNIPDMLEDLMNAVEAAEIEKRRGIFISHGHEELIKFKLKDFFERRIGRQTVVLSEQPNAGLTVVEKLERASDRCCFAVVLMTRDDQVKDGGLRARQNVVYELGFFQGKFGRKNVVLLVEKDVELFSNISGIVYIQFDRTNIEGAFESLRLEIEDADAR